MSMLLFMLSLGGIPFVAGFWAKLFVLLAVWGAGYGWLVLLGAGVSVVALFYYLKICRAIYMNAPTTEAPIEIDFGTRVGIAVSVAGIVVFGVWPGPLVEASSAASRMLLAALS